jgi:two-component sensor histidine kinase
MDYTITCGLILNELVTNSFKHGLVDQKHGVLDISLRIDAQNHVTFQISDNGPGLPPELDIDQNKSLGLKIVNILVSGQLKGTIDIISPPGATFLIQFTNTQ